MINADNDDDMYILLLLVVTYVLRVVNLRIEDTEL